MEAKIEGAPSFSHVHVTLGAGESILLEPDAMASMSPSITIKTKLNGGFFRGLMRKMFGGESLFINELKNESSKPEKLVFTQPTPGDIKEIDLSQSTICLQPGSFIGATQGVVLGLKWAGFVSWFAGMGLFKTICKGTGKVYFGGYGGLLFKQVKTPFIVDNDHLIAMEPGVKLKPKLAGGLFSSFFGGEGVVLEVSGQGSVALQTRSLSGLAKWTNPKLWR